MHITKRPGTSERKIKFYMVSEWLLTSETAAVRLSNGPAELRTSVFRDLKESKSTSNFELS